MRNRKRYFITEFLGTCVSKEIGDLACLYGYKVSYKYALKLIKEFDESIYEALYPEYNNPWDNETNIKLVKGVRYLHIVHSQTDYLFKLDYNEKYTN